MSDNIIQTEVLLEDTKSYQILLLTRSTQIKCLSTCQKLTSTDLQTVLLKLIVRGIHVMGQILNAKQNELNLRTWIILVIAKTN